MREHPLNRENSDSRRVLEVGLRDPVCTKLGEQCTLEQSMKVYVPSVDGRRALCSGMYRRDELLDTFKLVDDPQQLPLNRPCLSLLERPKRVDDDPVEHCDEQRVLVSEIPIQCVRGHTSVFRNVADRSGVVSQLQEESLGNKKDLRLFLDAVYFGLRSGHAIFS